MFSDAYKGTGGNYLSILYFVFATLLGMYIIMTLFIVAERLGHFIEEPMSNTPFDLPMYRFCAGITGDLLGTNHPLARMPDADDAVVWM